MTALPRFEFKDGSSFTAEQAAPANTTPFVKPEGDRQVPWDEADFRSWLSTLWHDAYDAKRPENERLKRNSCYVDGFHYNNAWMNQNNAIENHVWRVVETQVANTIASKPRPEIVASKGMSNDTAERLQEFGSWYMDLSDYDHAECLGTRDKRIYGWNIWLISIDPRTGLPVPKPYSVFDFYPDPAGRNEDECGHFIFAGPQPTASLRHWFPECAERIQPDNHASPAYDAVVRPWYEFLETAPEIGDATIPDSVMNVHPEGVEPTEGVSLVQAAGDTKENGVTTWLFQVLVRDAALDPCTYYGTMTYPAGHPDCPEGGEVPGMKHVDDPAGGGQGIPRCESGFWLVSMTAGGVLLEPPRQLDPCFLGENFVIDRVAQRTDRFWSMSDTDQVIPIQRGINRRTWLMDRSLELSANPPVLTNTGSGLGAQLNMGPVGGGEVLELSRGSDAKYLEFRGPSGQQFSRLEEGKSAVAQIAGTHAAMEGESTGANAPAAAIRRLDSNAQRRLQGGENPAHRARAKLLRKCMHAAGKKLQPEIVFRATDGNDKAVRSDELTMLYTIKFTEGSGSVEGRQEMEDKAIALYDREAIDELALLETFRWPNRVVLAERMAKRKLEEKIALAMAQAAAGGPGKGGGSSPPPGK